MKIADRRSPAALRGLLLCLSMAVILPPLAGLVPAPGERANSPMATAPAVIADAPSPLTAPESPADLAAQPGAAALSLARGSFVENRGQVANSAVRFYATAGGVQVGFEESAVVMVVNAPAPVPATSQAATPDLRVLAGSSGAVPSASAAVIRLTLDGANTVAPEGRGELPFRSNFFHGNDSTKWRAGVRTYYEVVYPAIYDGADLAFTMSPGGLKYEFRTQPFFDPAKILIEYAGTEGLTSAPDGALTIHTRGGYLTDAPPISFQNENPIRCNYEIRGTETVGFACKGVDPGLPMIIDPLIYSSYLGAANPLTMATDSAGNFYIAAGVSTTEFPATNGSYDVTYNGAGDLGILKIASNGSQLDFATYVGGTDRDATDWGVSLVVDEQGSAYVAGSTRSADFPITAGSFDSSLNGEFDLFVLKLNATGASLDYSTFLGGDDWDAVTAQGLALGAGGTLWVAGGTDYRNFPTTPGAYLTAGLGDAWDGFATRLNANGSALLYSTYFSDTLTDVNDGVSSIVVLSESKILLAGYTNSQTFPTTANGFDVTYNGNASSPYPTSDVFVAVLNVQTSTLEYGTFFGGAASEGVGAAAVSDDGELWVAGNVGTMYPDYAAMDDGFPLSSDAFDTVAAGLTEAFVFEFSLVNWTLDFSSFLGGSGYDFPNDLSLSAEGTAVIVGYTNSTDFPSTFNITGGSSSSGTQDGFLTVIGRNSVSILQSLIIGGSQEDRIGSLSYLGNLTFAVAGITNSSDFPVTGDALEANKTGTTWNGFVLVTSVNLTRGNVTVSSVPEGMSIVADGKTYTTPALVPCIVGGGVRIRAPPDVRGGMRFVIRSWADAASGDRVLPCIDAFEYTATYSREFLLTLASDPASLDAVLDNRSPSASRQNWLAEGSTHTIEALQPQIRNNTEWRFGSWSDGGAANHSILIAAPTNLTAVFFAAAFLLNVTTSPAGLNITVEGVVFPTPYSAWQPAGSSITLSAPSPQATGLPRRYVPSGWSDGAPANRTVAIGAPTSLVAIFSSEFLVTIGVDPEPISILVDGQSTQLPASFWWANGSLHTLEVPPDPFENAAHTVRYAFSKWSYVLPRNATISILGAITITAQLRAVAYAVDVATSPADPVLVLTAGGAIVNGPTRLWWPASTLFSVGTESPQVDRTRRLVFDSWSDGGARNHSVNITRPTTLTALFGQEYLVSFSDNLGAGDVVIDGTAHPLPFSVWWAAATIREIATRPPGAPNPGTRYTFMSWSDSGAQDHTITIWGAADFSATFQTQFRATLSSDRTPAACDRADCWYAQGTNASISVPSIAAGGAGTRYTFAGWSGDANGSEPALTVLMDGPKAIAANWQTQYLVTIASPYGTVHGAGWYKQGAVATVSLEPASVDSSGKTYHFTHWSGASSSNLTDLNLKVSAPLSLTAVWQEKQLAGGPTAPSTTQPGSAGVPLLPIALLGAAAAGGAALLLIMKRKRARSETSGSVELSATTEAPVTGGLEPPVDPVGPAMAACPQCGVLVAEGTMTCRNCHLEILWS